MDPEDDQGLDDSPEDGGSDSASGSDNSAPPADASADDKGEKRINDLMSKWQAAEARANAAEAKLKAPAKQGESADGDTGQAAQANEFLEFAREDARRRVFESDPRLAAAGLELSAITGTTLDEMKASLARQVKLVDGIESRVRSSVLTEHGLNPEVDGGARESLPSFETMSEEDFQKFLEKRDGKTW